MTRWWVSLIMSLKVNFETFLVWSLAHTIKMIDPCNGQNPCMHEFFYFPPRCLSDLLQASKLCRSIVLLQKKNPQKKQENKKSWTRLALVHSWNIKEYSCQVRPYIKWLHDVCSLRERELIFQHFYKVWTSSFHRPNPSITSSLQYKDGSVGVPTRLFLFLLHLPIW